MPLVISPASEADLVHICELIGEIEEYYGGTNTPGESSQVRQALFSSQPVARVLLARDADTVVGLASYSFLWPAAGAESSVYMKELYVRPSHRRNGIARELMAAVHAAARAAGCSRVEWTADKSNPSALHFYQALGMNQHSDKIFYRSE